MADGDFNAQPLRVLDTLYRFVGGQRGSRVVDLGAPILRVHDVSREAERAASFRFIVEISDTTAGTGTQLFGNRDDLNIINNAPLNAPGELGLTRENARVWLHDVKCAITNASKGNLAQATAWAYPPSDAPAATELYGRVLGTWNTLFDVPAEAAGSYRWLYDNTARYSFPARLPLELGLFQYRMNDGGAGAASYSFRLDVEICPRGVEPARA